MSKIRDLLEGELISTAIDALCDGELLSRNSTSQDEVDELYNYLAPLYEEGGDRVIAEDELNNLELLSNVDVLINGVIAPKYRLDNGSLFKYNAAQLAHVKCWSTQHASLEEAVAEYLADEELHLNEDDD